MSFTISNNDGFRQSLGKYYLTEPLGQQSPSVFFIGKPAGLNSLTRSKPLSTGITSPSAQEASAGNYIQNIKGNYAD
ncbi:MAG TPA: hypothetical protein P5325_01000 [Candidatus Woesebacteria bacterium]|nr:hypothetical protein [Candidatus Woesebacteria bacterium]